MNLFDEFEKLVGIDLDGDGTIGGVRTAPMPRPPEHHAQQFAAAHGRPPRQRALFIGINYVGTSAELRGCINDVRTLQGLVQQLGFPLDDMRSLSEDPSVPGYAGPPTRAEILAHLRWLVDDARRGDTLFLHYSGHGTSVADTSGDEADGKDEAMVPLDYQEAGVIVDDDIFAIVVAPLPDGVRLTAVLDCCHSGTLMDLPFMFEATRDNLAAGHMMAKRRQRRRRRHGGGGARETFFARAFDMDIGSQARSEMPGPDVIMFSGCMDSQTSADVSNVQSFDVPMDPNAPGAAGGACTNAMAEVLYRYPSLKFAHLLQAMRENLDRRGFTQIPQMSSTKPVDLNATFSLWGDFDG